MALTLNKLELQMAVESLEHTQLFIHEHYPENAETMAAVIQKFRDARDAAPEPILE